MTISDLLDSAEAMAAGIGTDIEMHQTGGIATAGHRNAIQGRNSPRPKVAFPDQCDISTGTVIESNMLRVTPPRIRSCNREWP